METERLLADMVDYIEETDRVIGFLSKSAETPRAFSDEALHKAAEALSDAALISDEDRAELVDLFRNEPDKALTSLVKVATMLPQAEDVGSMSLGSPKRTIVKVATRRESDRVLLERLGLA